VDGDYIKSMIQQALWEAYQRTDNEEYKAIYDAWYENYEKIKIEGLEVGK
jgi:hypothetical protein